MLLAVSAAASAQSVALVEDVAGCWQIEHDPLADSFAAYSYLPSPKALPRAVRLTLRPNPSAFPAHHPDGALAVEYPAGFTGRPFTYWHVQEGRVYLGSYYPSGMWVSTALSGPGTLAGLLVGYAPGDLIEPPGPRDWEVAATLTRTTCERFE